MRGRLPVGGNATVPEYHDDEFKAMRPQDCTEQLFQTKLLDPVTDETTVLHHQSRYLQVWTGGVTTFGVDAVVLEPLSAMSDGFNVRLTNETPLSVSWKGGRLQEKNVALLRHAMLHVLGDENTPPHPCYYA